MALAMFVGQQVQHAEQGKGEVLEVWPEVNGNAFWAQVMFNNGAIITCKDSTLTEAKHGN